MPRERGLNNQHEWLTAKEAADLLGVRTATIYAYATRGLLGATARGPGKKALYPRHLVETLRKKAAARAGHGAVAAGALRWGEPVLDSSITQLTVRGPVYRGKRAIELVEKPYERVAELLWGFEADWSARLPRVTTRGARPSLHAWIDVVVAQNRTTDWRVMAPALMHRLACAAGEHEEAAEREESIAGAFATSLLGRSATKQQLRLINAGLILLADHELNPSTFAARVAASARAPWVDCLISALGAAAGTRHASACDDAERFWRGVLATKQLPSLENPPGFDAGAYPQGDPRAEKLLTMLRPSLNGPTRKRVDEVLEAVDDATGQLPAVDSALALTAAQIGLPIGSATLIFVLGRVAGWLAHVEEQRESSDPIRPRARFVEPFP
ncbi:MAG: citrate synthase [Archangium sp.]